jgi:hypothetical protein
LAKQNGRVEEGGCHQAMQYISQGQAEHEYEAEVNENGEWVDR